MRILLSSTIAIACILPALVQAQATRTWVSGVGDDANPGSRTAPCKTFAGAISKTATGGVIDVLDPGGFGAVTITKSITLEGSGDEGGILVSGTHGIVISAGPTDVVILRNLTFEGLSTGLSAVNILSAGAVHIENCRINAFTTSGISLLSGVTNAQLFIKDTTIHGCAPAGINLAPTAPATVLLDRVNITGCGNGVSAGAGTKTVVTESTASGNSGAGFLVGTNAEMTLRRVTSSDNQVGVQSAGTAVLADSVIVDNSVMGLEAVARGKLYTYHNNFLANNANNGKATSMLSTK